MRTWCRVSLQYAWSGSGESVEVVCQLVVD